MILYCRLVLGIVLLLFTFTSQARNICQLVKRHPEWHRAAKKTEKKWGVPVHIQFAIIDIESDFNAKTTTRNSSSKGFAQALNEPWGEYLKANGKNHNRYEFHSSTDFIGWYASQAKQQANISPKNAYELYLAYHEGIRGYQKIKKRPKHWVLRLARHVSALSDEYKKKLSSC
ncbi:transglycosylase SLT domain-containing protein [Legionella sp. W05-934-2]|jgi:hypothetical protein|uniref:transglycosylase SLT domain-containing protein n=1 Tax=Legionella sp. W05-934-2 TaxID=1198649 RepID=UPI00346268B7